MVLSDSSDPRPDSQPTSFAERDARTSGLFSALFAAREAGDDREADRLVEQLVLLYLDLCSSMAGRYDGRGVEHDDLVQVARLALVKSINRYQPGHAPTFAAYAVPTISGELKRWFRDRGWVIRPPRRLQELRSVVVSTRARLEQELGFTPCDVELAEAVGVSVEEIKEVARAASGFHPLSLDGGLSDDERLGMSTFLACTDGAIEGTEDRVCLGEALTELDDDERELLLMRYVEEMTSGRSVQHAVSARCRSHGRCDASPTDCRTSCGRRRPRRTRPSR